MLHGLEASPIHEVLLEESVIGWKEYELEVMRDLKDNVVIVCSIENLDPMGVHTGDSITVAPQQTLTDKEYQSMRDDALKIIRAIGVETGGSNIQFAVNPKNGRRLVIEMNPRVSRSSALASKATGFAIAKIATKLAVGYTLDEISNDITKLTPASFEPTIDYCVVKIPRWDFEKFKGVDETLGVQMKSVGEAMAFGRTFKEALQKALRSLEQGRHGLGADGKDLCRSAEAVSCRAGGVAGTRTRIHRVPASGQRVLPPLRHACSVSKMTSCTRSRASTPGSSHRSVRSWRWNRPFATRRPWMPRSSATRRSTDSPTGSSPTCAGPMRRACGSCGIAHGIIPVYKTVDTCGAEFHAETPYHYSTYEQENESVRSDRKKVIILGGGPNRIGQGIEFDYCCVHGVMGLAEEGYETIMVNCNPETVSTDYDTTDKLYFEPLTLEDVLNICDLEKPEGLIVSFGGQTPLEAGQGRSRRTATRSSGPPPKASTLPKTASGSVRCWMN